MTDVHFFDVETEHHGKKQKFCFSPQETSKSFFGIQISKNKKVFFFSENQIMTVGGNGFDGLGDDQGCALQNPISGPQGLCADHLGNLFVLDR